ncbi:GbsR/MarR family transcriptional regulator [Ningiella sp. W23]|uniref:GbsR/MarR family transcriptional regulator n=1 Tax=Ningiella sp. W23 TaxID=3023715 RepID=UPI003756818F
MGKSKQKLIEDFVENMGLIAQDDGMPRIAGRVMGLLMMEEAALSFSQLSERLDVSRASISTNTRLLLHLGIIQRIGKRGERQDYFSLAANPFESLLGGIVSRMQRAKLVIKETRQALPKEMDHAMRSLDDIQTFYESFERAIRPLASPQSLSQSSARTNTEDS